MKLLSTFNILKIGAAEEIRTPDFLVRSQVLYPAELQPPIMYYTTY